MSKRVVEVEQMFHKWTPVEQVVVDQIVARASMMFRQAGYPRDTVDILMDLSAVQKHTPLRLTDLLQASEADFWHDLYGIFRHLDRNDGTLLNHFLPRFAQPAQQETPATGETIKLEQSEGVQSNEQHPRMSIIAWLSLETFSPVKCCTVLITDGISVGTGQYFPSRRLPMRERFVGINILSGEAIDNPTHWAELGNLLPVSQLQ